MESVGRYNTTARHLPASAHIGRLVNDQNIFIFIQNGEQHFVWHNIVGAFVFFYADMKGVSDMERFFYITPDAVF